MLAQSNLTPGNAPNVKFCKTGLFPTLGSAKTINNYVESKNLDELITNEVTTVITMLPEGKNSKEVYLGEKGIINKVSKNCLLIDCSTIDIQTSIEIGKKANEKGIKMIDAPVSGGIMGAEKATLNIMVGGTKEAFDIALPLLKIMGKNIFHAGDLGSGTVSYTHLTLPTKA